MPDLAPNTRIENDASLLLKKCISRLSEDILIELSFALCAASYCSMTGRCYLQSLLVLYLRA